MIKGVGRRIILLNNTESELFDQAIFILKQDSTPNRQEIVRECERMINQRIDVKRKTPTDKWKSGFFILLVAVIILSFWCVLK